MRTDISMLSELENQLVLNIWEDMEKKIINALNELDVDQKFIYIDIPEGFSIRLQNELQN